MASVASPYGLKPVFMGGTAAYTGGTIREYPMTVNSATAIFKGDVVQITNGQPVALTATITAGTTVGVVGVCMGVSYWDPTLKQQQFAQYLPANAVTGNYTNIRIRVLDDPNQLYQIQGSAAFGSLTNGVYGAVGKNAALGNFGGSTSTGNSTINLVVGANGGSLGATATLAMRIVDVVNLAQVGNNSNVNNPNDAFPEIIVRFNHTSHSWTTATGN